MRRYPLRQQTWLVPLTCGRDGSGRYVRFKFTTLQSEVILITWVQARMNFTLDHGTFQSLAFES